MKIIQLNTYDNNGGAARAVFRLAKALNKQGVDARLVVRKKNIQESFVYSANEKLSFLKPYLDYLPAFLFTRKRMPFFSAITNDNILKIIDKYQPDLLHLNWISEGFLKIETLAKINIPIVWTLHDSWAYTGGCHMHKGCEKYLTGCGACPYLSPKLKYDLSSYNFDRKQKVYKQIKNLKIVTPSSWLKAEVMSSRLLNECDVEVIPNGLNVDFFTGIDKEKAKEKLGIDPHKKVIVFGGINATKDENKGFGCFVDSVKYFKTKDLTILVFGNNKLQIEYLHKIKIKYLGQINNDEKLRTIYAAGDVTVVPSKQEVFGQVITESMSCGVPVVAFDTTGPAEIIKQKKNGYLAKAFQAEDLALGIDWVLEDKEKWNQLSAYAVTSAKTRFSSEIIAKKYIELFKNVLENNDSE